MLRSKTQQTRQALGQALHGVLLADCIRLAGHYVEEFDLCPVSGATCDNYVEMICQVIAESGECLIIGMSPYRPHCVWNAATGARCPRLEVGVGVKNTVALTQPGAVVTWTCARTQLEFLTFRDAATPPIRTPIQQLLEMPLVLVSAGIGTKFAYAHHQGSGSTLTFRDKFGEAGKLPLVAGRQVIQVTPGSGITAGSVAVLWRTATGSHTWSVVNIAGPECMVLFDTPLHDFQFLPNTPVPVSASYFDTAQAWVMKTPGKGWSRWAEGQEPCACAEPRANVNVFAVEGGDGFAVQSGTQFWCWRGRPARWHSVPFRQAVRCNSIIAAQDRRGWGQILKILPAEAPLWLNCAQDLLVAPDPTGVVRLGPSSLNHIDVGGGGSRESIVFKPGKAIVMSLPDGLGVACLHSGGTLVVFI